jgi:hypothetical protein
MRQLRLSFSLLMILAACGPGGGSGGQCEDILPGDLVITEFFADYDAPTGGSGADAGKEWFEIFNASDAPIDLEDLTITLSRPDGTSDHTHTMGTLTIDAGDYAVLGNVTPELVAGHLDYGYGADLGDMFNTDGGKLTIGCGDTEIDVAQYDEVTPGRSSGFDGGIAPDFTANDDLLAWCEPPVEPAYQYEDSNYGTPGQTNVDCMSVTPGTCNDGGTPRATVTPVAGDVVITEVHPNPSGDDDLQEWFEIYAVNAVDLNGVQVARSTGSPDTIDSPDCIHVDAGGYAVIAKSADSTMNGMLPAVAGTFGISLVDTGDLHLNTPAGGLLDAVTWTNAGADKTRQLDPDTLDAAGNDTENLWCDATIAWAGADLGSPGAVNEQCPPPAGSCTDPDDATLRASVPPTAGQLVITEWMADLPGADTDKEWFELKASASFDLNGLQAGLTTLGATPIVANGGTCLEVTAGEYLLFAETDTVTGLPPVTGTEPLTLGNATGSLVIGINGGVLDTKTWATAAVAGTSFQIDTDGTQCVAPAGTPEYNTVDHFIGTPKAVHTVECP